MLYQWQKQEKKYTNIKAESEVGKNAIILHSNYTNTGVTVGTYLALKPQDKIE